MSQDSQKPDNNETDISNCLVRVISNELMECRVDKECRHALPFGNGKFCRHPLKHQIPSQDH